MRRAVVVVPALLAALAACDALIVEPDGEVPISVQLQIEESVDTTFARVLGKVQRARLSFDAEGFTLDTTVTVGLGADSAGGVATARIALGLPRSAEVVTVRAELVLHNWVLFVADGVLTPGQPDAVRLVLTPIAGVLRVGPGPTFDALGQSFALFSRVQFASDDDWPISYQPEWTSEDPSIIEVQPGAVAVPRGNGVTNLVATFGNLHRIVGASVQQEPHLLTGLAPADTTISVGDSFPLRVFGEDANGYPLLPGTRITWVYGGGVSVDEDGILTAHTAGPAFVHGLLGSTQHTVNLTVNP
jgi:hypothetical protein